MMNRKRSIARDESFGKRSKLSNEHDPLHDPLSSELLAIYNPTAQTRRLSFANLRRDSILDLPQNIAKSNFYSKNDFNQPSKSTFLMNDMKKRNKENINSNIVYMQSKKDETTKKESLMDLTEVNKEEIILKNRRNVPNTNASNKINQNILPSIAKSNQEDTIIQESFMDLTEVNKDSIIVRNRNANINQDETMKQESLMDLTEVNKEDEIFLRNHKISPKVIDRNSDISYNIISNFSQFNQEDATNQENSLMDLTEVNNQDSIVIRKQNSPKDTRRDSNLSYDIFSTFTQNSQVDTTKQNSVMELTEINTIDDIFLRNRIDTTDESVTNKNVDFDLLTGLSQANNTIRDESMELSENIGHDEPILRQNTKNSPKIEEQSENSNSDVISTFSRKIQDLRKRDSILDVLKGINHSNVTRNQKPKKVKIEEKAPEEMTFVSTDSIQFSTPKLLSDIFNMTSEKTFDQNTVSTISNDDSIKEDTILKLLYNRNSEKNNTLKINQSDMSNSVILKSKNEKEILNFRTKDIIPISNQDDVTEDTLVLGEEAVDEIDYPIQLETESDYINVINLFSSCNGWRPLLVEKDHVVIDFKNAVAIDVYFDMESDILNVREINHICRLKDKEENHFLEGLISNINLKETFSLTSMPFSYRLHRASVQIGRILDLVKEIRIVGDSMLLDRVSSTGIKLRFSNKTSKRRFDLEMSFNSDYPFMSEFSFEFNNIFGETKYEVVRKIIDEEVEKSSYRLFTRVCKRLHQIC